MTSFSEFVPYATQCIDQDDIDAVLEVLRSKWLTQGPAVASFEKAVAQRCNVKHAIAVSSATAGLHLGCLALGLTSDDLLWTSPNSFTASANCARYCGADVDFVDIDERTYNISVAALEQKLRECSGSGRLPKVVVPVHFAGQPAELSRIRDLSRMYGFFVLEDAAHAIGSLYRGAPIGDCQFSDLAVFSFHPVKVMTTGEGGILTTNSDDLHRRLMRLRSHGITRDEIEMQGAPDGPWYFEQLELGLNYRLTDIQAALGESQLTKLGQFIQRRSELAARYDEAFRDLPVTLPWQHPDTQSAWHLYVVRLRGELVNRKREIFQTLRSHGIGANVHFIPIHTHPYYQQLGFRKGQFPEAERHYAEALTLPLFPKLTNLQQERVVDVVRKALQ